MTDADGYDSDGYPSAATRTRILQCSERKLELMKLEQPARLKKLQWIARRAAQLAAKAEAAIPLWTAEADKRLQAAIASDAETYALVWLDEILDNPPIGPLEGNESVSRVKGEACGSGTSPSCATPALAGSAATGAADAPGGPTGN